jgi:hypothetical protein
VQGFVELPVSTAVQPVSLGVLPELAGIGAVPAWRAKQASVAKRSAPAVCRSGSLR